MTLHEPGLAALLPGRERAEERLIFLALTCELMTAATKGASRHQLRSDLPPAISLGASQTAICGAEILTRSSCCLPRVCGVDDVISIHKHAAKEYSGRREHEAAV